MADNNQNGNGNILNNNRIIYLSGIIDDEKTKNVVSSIIRFEIQDPTKDILFYIDSTGGTVDGFIAMHDIIKNICRCDVATICVGKAMSSGMMLLISGTKGKRFITPNSRVLIHPISQFSVGKTTVTQMETRAEETRRLQSFFESLIVKYTNMTKTQVKKYMTCDSFLDTKTCLEMGIIDYIIDNSNILYNNINI